jgi:N-acetylglutamate synthase-like GNAT family acetyltransferase
MTEKYNHQLIDRLHFPLAKKIFQAYYPSGKANKADPIWVLTEQEKIRVCLRLKQFEHCKLLTAMVTHPDFRNQGLGRILLTALELDPRQPFSTKDCYCFAFSHLQDFYQSVHFNLIDIEALPDVLKGRFQAYCNAGKTLIPMKLYQPHQT